MFTRCRSPHGHLVGSLALSTALLLATALSVQAQEEPQERSVGPLSNFVLTGYGTVGYDAELGNDFRHDFNAGLSPILLFDLGSDLLFETELKFAPHGDGVDVEMEYAQASYLGFERLIVTGGKFLLPFGVFGERLHAAWINSMPSFPLVYAHAHGGVASGALLPILSDVGAMARYALPAGNGWRLDVSGWISQGPRLLGDEGADHQDEDDAHSLAPTEPPRLSAGPATPTGRNARGGLAATSGTPLFNGAPDPATGADLPFDIPTVAYGTSFSTSGEDRNRMLGTRVGLLRPPSLEIYASVFHAKYNPGDYLDLIGANLAAEWRRGDLEFRGEAVVVWQEFVHEDAYEHLRSPAYYVQAARRFGSFEPVVRWSDLLDGTVGGETARHGRRQFAVGLNYWLKPSVPIKAAYELNRGGEDRLLIQWALGF